MKLLLFPILFIKVLTLSGQNTYKGLPIVNAKTTQSNFVIPQSDIKIGWVISPKIKHDSLKFTCYSRTEQVVFKTDIDSLAFAIEPGKNVEFYVLLNNKKYAHTIVAGIEPKYSHLTFDTIPRLSQIQYWFDSTNNDGYALQMRQQFKLDSIIQHAYTDTDRALALLNWVHRQWKHNGSNSPSKNDPISILEEAAKGKSFRCVEYGIVLAGCLNAVGLNARVLGLKTRDVETTKSGAGHVVTEVYLADIGKWAYLDGQWDVMPILEGIPLNVVEFQKAITHNYEKLEIASGSNVAKLAYVNWIYPYLYYFDAPFDSRLNTDDKQKIDGKSSLMLVPIGAKEPKVFQKLFPIINCLYTNSVTDFYPTF
jgi:hypothetical protein